MQVFNGFHISRRAEMYSTLYLKINLKIQKCDKQFCSEFRFISFFFQIYFQINKFSNKNIYLNSLAFKFIFSKQPCQELCYG